MDLELSISRMKVFRAKSIAKEQLYGDYERQYNLLRDYCLELQTNNPGTTVKLEVCNEPNPDVQTRIFKRIYICLGALKLGFKSGKRELLGLDGCFLKGPHPRQILTAVGLDSNNGIYPLAYAIVEAETTSSWTWFLECLGDDLDLDASCNFTFVSDRQKGIIPAIAKVFPNAEHRWCLRHIHENMKLQWRGEEFRDHLWRCATHTTIRHFERSMDEFKDFSAEAHEWLSKIPPVYWARSHFSGRAHSDCLLNNLCEVFNSKLEHGRDKPIITCLEYIRVYLMKRHCIVQKEIDKCKSLLTPTATTILDTIKTAASKYRALFCGSGKYQVTGMMFDQYVVNLKEGTCSCRYWEITGIVCRHGVCVIWEHIQNGEKAQQPEYWVHPCYKLETWRAMYCNKIDPINGRSMWPKSRCPTTLIPPTHHTQVGRPKKKRRRAIDEASNQSKKLSRKFLTVTCSKCHNKGHNSRTCKGQGGSSQRAVGGSSQGGVGGSSKDAFGVTSQGSVGGSSEDFTGGLRAKKIDKGKKASSRT
ncbi:uncharacterized protein LOC128132443 [Lactuca sativa]|uniref:uncharacterized protein LOC128132443 n=1 Tax=Lactuca sativa TaxID=4236 RepID=UPI0022B00386|nr:uncharacterized protein LOC128132443 [Lactuca sativa]